MLISGCSIFLRLSHIAPMKALSMLTIGLGVLALGWSRPRGRSLLANFTVILVVTAYLTLSAFRYPGLLKDYPPYSTTIILGFSVKMFLLLAAATVVMTLVVHTVRRKVRESSGTA